MCTLPSKKMKLCTLITIIVFILLISRKTRKIFIASSTFQGYKKGFVYKMEDGKLGYHVDNVKYLWGLTRLVYSDSFKL